MTTAANLEREREREENIILAEDPIYIYICVNGEEITPANRTCHHSAHTESGAVFENVESTNHLMEVIL